MSAKRGRSSFADATLGIDLGSTSTRVCLWCPTGKPEDIDVDNTENTGHIPPGDFSSVGYPFEPEGPVYLGGDVDPNRRPISLKYAFYALAEANKKDDMLKQYVLVTPLTSQKGNPAFRDRLIQGLRELFLVLRKRVDSTCFTYSLKVKTIGISIPSQWTLDFERVYREIIVDVFEHPPEKISFHSETEALAHTLLRNHRIALPECSDDMYDVYLFLDFGGHNMNGCIFNVVYGQDHDASFYKIGDSFGAGGGSEQWSYYVGEEFANLVRTLRKRRLTSEEWKFFVDQFNSCKPNIGPSSSDGRMKIGGWDMTLGSTFINDSFELAHRNVLEKAKDLIAEVSQLRVATPYVIVSGGTAKHKTVQDRLRTICKDHGIHEPLFSNEWSIAHGSARIARGVAYAAGSRLTFEQFLQRGAAFGIQRKQKSIRGDGKLKEGWESLADLIFSKNVQKGLEFKAGTGKDKFKIICDPFFEPGETPNKLQFDHCYDFLYLGKLKKGKWKITFSVTDTQDSPSLVLKSSFVYHDRKSKKRGRTTVRTFDKEHSTNSLPLYFDGGANCYFAHKETFDRDHFCRGMPSRSPEDAEEANNNRPYDSDNQSECSDPESVTLADDHASSPNEVETRTTNNPTTAQHHNVESLTRTSAVPTSQPRFVLKESYYQAPVPLMAPFIPTTQSNELTRNEVHSPRSRSGKGVDNPGGLYSVTSRTNLNAARDTRIFASTGMAEGSKSRPVKGPRREIYGIEEDTESDSFESGSDYSE